MLKLVKKSKAMKECCQNRNDLFFLMLFHLEVDRAFLLFCKRTAVTLHCRIVNLLKRRFVVLVVFFISETNAFDWIWIWYDWYGCSLSHSSICQVIPLVSLRCHSTNHRHVLRIRPVVERISCDFCQSIQKTSIYKNNK